MTLFEFRFGENDGKLATVEEEPQAQPSAAPAPGGASIDWDAALDSFDARMAGGGLSAVAASRADSSSRKFAQIKRDRARAQDRKEVSS